MHFICRKCKARMLETLHFDYANGKYEVRLDCPNQCTKHSSHIAFTQLDKSVTLKLDIGV